MPTIQISALDTLFFRDGKPFSMGENTSASGIFPPPPSVFYGALRTAHAAQIGCNLDGIQQTTTHIEIQDLNYLLGNERVFPLPLDLVKLKNDTSNKAKLLRPIAKETLKFREQPDISHILYRKEHIETIPKAVLSSFEFEEYLNGKLKDFNYHSFENFIQTETKIGIARNFETRTASIGKFYRMDMKRLHYFTEHQESKQFSFLVTTNETELNPYVRLGAEGKIAILKDISTINLNVQYKDESQYFKIYFQTPAFFHEGYIPNWSKYFPDLGISTITCAIDRPVSIGGFDMALRKPKKMFKAIPSGSVYYLHTTLTLGKVKEYLIEKNITKLTDERANEGFGLFHIANLDFPKAMLINL